MSAFTADLGALIAGGWIVTFSPSDDARLPVLVSLFHDLHAPKIRSSSASSLEAASDVLRVALIEQRRNEEQAERCGAVFAHAEKTLVCNREPNHEGGHYSGAVAPLPEDPEGVTRE